MEVPRVLNPQREQRTAGRGSSVWVGSCSFLSAHLTRMPLHGVAVSGFAQPIVRIKTESELAHLLFGPFHIRLRGAATWRD
jgi:hypothetical protein